MGPVQWLLLSSLKGSISGSPLPDMTYVTTVLHPVATVQIPQFLCQNRPLNLNGLDSAEIWPIDTHV